MGSHCVCFGSILMAKFKQTGILAFLFLVSWGLMTRHSGLLWGVIRSDNNFRIILYFSKDFEERVTCIKVLNYGNSLKKSMFKDKYLPLLYTVYLIKATTLINKA